MDGGPGAGSPGCAEGQGTVPPLHPSPEVETAPTPAERLQGQLVLPEGEGTWGHQMHLLRGNNILGPR